MRVSASGAVPTFSKWPDAGAVYLQMLKPSRLPLGVHVLPISAHSSAGAFGSQKRTACSPGIGLLLHDVAQLTVRYPAFWLNAPQHTWPEGQSVRSSQRICEEPPPPPQGWRGLVLATHVNDQSPFWRSAQQIFEAVGQ